MNYLLINQLSSKENLYEITFHPQITNYGPEFLGTFGLLVRSWKAMTRCFWLLRTFRHCLLEIPKANSPKIPRNSNKHDLYLLIQENKNEIQLQSTLSGKFRIHIYFRIQEYLHQFNLTHKEMYSILGNSIISMWWQFQPFG